MTRALLALTLGFALLAAAAAETAAATAGRGGETLHRRNRLRRPTRSAARAAAEDQLKGPRRSRPRSGGQERGGASRRRRRRARGAPRRSTTLTWSSSATSSRRRDLSADWDKFLGRRQRRVRPDPDLADATRDGDARQALGAHDEVLADRRRHSAVRAEVQAQRPPAGELADVLGQMVAGRGAPGSAAATMSRLDRDVAGGLERREVPREVAVGEVEHAAQRQPAGEAPGGRGRSRRATRARRRRGGGTARSADAVERVDDPEQVALPVEVDGEQVREVVADAPAVAHAASSGA